MSAEDDDGTTLPLLPVELHDRLLALLFGDPARRERAFAELLAANPDQADALRAHRRRHQQMEAQADAPGAAGDEDTIAGYRLLGTLGEGGMGTVYRAEQLAPIHRLVALKVVKQGMDSKAVLARFEQERQALGAMDHDAIAKVFDCGTNARGQPYFAMELVEGLPIQRYCDERRLPLRERIELFAQVCQGVQHAHQKGVIHRDLKPGNVLVTDQGGRHAVKIIDFGVARATDRRLGSRSMSTEQGLVVGTPEYMSPEQAAGDSRWIDTRSDIYSLGVILYELLVGALPFPGIELRAAGLAEIQRRLKDDDPPKPSTRFSGLGGEATTCAALRRVSVEALRRALAGDLDWVVLKAMAKEPERRYESATALAEDLRRYLGHEPLMAGPPSAGYRLRKLVRRYRGRVVAGSAVLVTGVVGAVVALQFALREQAKNREFDLLKGVVLHEQAIAKEKELYPPWPHKIEAMEEWLREDAGRLLAMKPAIEQTVKDLRARALPATQENRTVRLKVESEQFLHDELAKLLGKLSNLESEKATVEQRLSWARRIEDLTMNHPKARCTWAEARAAITKADGVAASRLYAGKTIELRDQDMLGLVPIGMNPMTKLWEFYELRSAWDGKSDPGEIAIPAHRADGWIEVSGETGIVFVLLAGGTFTMGAQKESKDRPNFDPQAVEDETPHDVALAPFLLARHEMTQGQWARLWSGEESMRWPSGYKVGRSYAGIPMPIGQSHPVEGVNWETCEPFLRRCGMSLPTEAQWEFGCRAGQSTPWYTGELPTSLAGHANVLDQDAVKIYPEWGVAESFEDGFAGPAPVGHYRANSFGLYDVHGNLFEWCLDSYGSYTTPYRAGDGLRLADPSNSRVARGGSSQFPAALARSAKRSEIEPKTSAGNLGLRPARALRLGN